MTREEWRTDADDSTISIMQLFAILVRFSAGVNKHSPQLRNLARDRSGILCEWMKWGEAIHHNRREQGGEENHISCQKGGRKRERMADQEC